MLKGDRAGKKTFKVHVDGYNFLVRVQGYGADFLSSFKKFPPRQEPASFSLNQVLEKLEASYKN